MSTALEPVLSSPCLSAAGIRHGFFTRQGGVSRPPWDSLNFSTATGDDPIAVRESFARAGDWLGVAPDRIFVLSQVHGSVARFVRRSESAEAIGLEQGDVVLGADPDVACGVRVADCAPVLLVDRRSGLAAAAHAGWRGVARGVLAAAVRSLRARAAEPLDLLVAIGPHIEACCFEVGEEVAAELERAAGPGEPCVDRSDGRIRVDLRRIMVAQLGALCGSSCTIDHVRGCTVCDPARFHSYRRSGPRSGRMLAAVVPPGSTG